MTWFKESKQFPPGSPERSGGAQDNYNLPSGDIPQWEERFEYDEGREVRGTDGNYYRATEDHTASEIFANDLADNKWELIAGSGLDTNNQVLEITGEGDELTLSNGSVGGVPIPDSVIDMTQFASLYDNWAPTKSGKLLPGAFTGNPKRAIVTFATAFNTPNYSPSVTITGPDNYSVTVESVIAGSFVINLNSNVAPTQDVSWHAVRHGEY
jgi:hypothetical protein